MSARVLSRRVVQNLSCLALKRHYANKSQSHGKSIGEKVRELQQKRMWNLVLGGTVAAGVVIFALNAFQENLMFYMTPSQALEKYLEGQAKSRLRLGGLVLEGSVKHFTNSTEMEFIITDLANEILVKYRGALPDLFREGHSVVAEGFLKPYPEKSVSTSEEQFKQSEMIAKVRKAGCFFAATEVLAKHDEKYMPKEVAAAVEKNKLALDESKGRSPEEVIQLTESKEAKQVRQGKFSKVGQSPNNSQDYEVGS